MAWWENWFGEEYLDLYPHRDLDSARREAAFALERLPRGAVDTPARPVLRVRPARPAIRRGGRFPGRPRLLGAASSRSPGAQSPPAPRPRRHAPAALCRRALSVPSSTSSPASDTFSPRPTTARSSARSRASCRAAAGFSATRSASTMFSAAWSLEESRSTGDREYRITTPLERGLAPHREGDRGAPRRGRRNVPGKRPGLFVRELTGLLESAGLAVEAAWGDFDGCPAGAESPRLILLARKS